MMLRFLAENEDSFPSLYNLDDKLKYWWEENQTLYVCEGEWGLRVSDVLTDILIPEGLV